MQAIWIYFVALWWYISTCTIVYMSMAFSAARSMSEDRRREGPWLHRLIHSETARTLLLVMAWALVWACQVRLATKVLLRMAKVKSLLGEARSRVQRQGPVR